ncbi:integral membrane protein [Prosthecobacter debontii]|uniref:Integral membrane protein n=1 Tax=Prosthecobacter debontii TaxID=48467 RepID=A0A1T4XKY7_9BACT|nr:DUF3817 domain-containing protein [Prosthecobacter debontii]SKA90063.1 integral membrane protein [Prosthecobacter debontii]
MPASPLASLLRRLTLVEGVSFLLLLGVAMPLKYFAELPIAVKIVGWAHGLLFVVVCALLLQVMIKAQWPVLRCVLVLISALVPFGPFLLDSRLKAWVNEGK